MSNNIAEFMRAATEPFPDSNYGSGVRCSAYLIDGTFLPCVMLRLSEPTTQLALRRFKELAPTPLRTPKNPSYEEVVRNFVARGNRVNAYDIAKVEESRFAIPLSLLKQIRGETTMAWTGFVLEMKDKLCFSFGTSFLTQFFNLPDNYTFQDVAQVHNHSYVSATGAIANLREGSSTQPADYDVGRVFRERPYFVCSVDA
jgi:hypothetical protein